MPTQELRSPEDSKLTGLRVIASLKLVKAVLLTGIGLGLFSSLNRDFGETVRKITVNLRIDPENHIIQLLLEWLGRIPPRTFRTVGIISLFYAAELYIEGVGLWLNQAWAQYLLVVATGFFIPEEAYGCVRHFNVVRLSLLIVNIIILWYVVRVLWTEKHFQTFMKGILFIIAGLVFSIPTQLCLWAGEVPLTEALRQKLPADLQDSAAKWLRLDGRLQAAWLNLTPGDLRADALDAMAQVPAAEDFILGKLPGEPPAAQGVLLDIMLSNPDWQVHPGLAETLRGIGVEEKDTSLALRYLDAARRMEIKQLRQILARRIAGARAAGDTVSLEQLAKEDETWMKLDKGAMLPNFLSKPPPLFTLQSADQPIRVVAMGDFGEGTPGQRKVAAAMQREAQGKPFDFGVTLGDNFYPKGMPTLDDPRWADWWEKLYGPLGIKFYATLGNHDWYDPDSPTVEIMHSGQSPSWRMPAPYYTFLAGPVQFFALDTDDIAEAQVMWLERAIAQSRARWKLVYGHHPIFSAAPEVFSAYMRQRLWPVLRGKVDVYLSGHHHAMEHMAPQDGVHFWVAGGGGAHLHPVLKDAPHTEMAKSTFGFAIVEADENSLALTLLDSDGRRLDGEVLKK